MKKEALEKTQEALVFADGLIGAGEFKAYVRRLALLKEHLKEAPKPEEALFLLRRPALFSINAGDGFKTQMKCLSLLWEGIAGTDTVPVKIHTLPWPDGEEGENSKKATPRDQVLSVIEEEGFTQPWSFRILCLNIPEWIDCAEGPEFRAVLSRLRKTLRDQILVFRIPAVDTLTLKRVKEAIGWFMNVDEVYCPPFSVEEYYQYALREMEKRDMVPGEGTEEMIRELLARERRRPSFTGFHSVKRLVDEMMFSALRNSAGKGEGNG